MHRMQVGCMVTKQVWEVRLNPARPILHCRPSLPLHFHARGAAIEGRRRLSLTLARGLALVVLTCGLMLHWGPRRVCLGERRVRLGMSGRQ